MKKKFAVTYRAPGSRTATTVRVVTAPNSAAARKKIEGRGHAVVSSQRKQ